MQHRSFIALFLSVIAVGALGAENPLRVELVSEATSIQAGRPFHVGLLLQHPDGYHSYWKFPGIVGVPTGMKWNLPKGWKAEPIEWPEPERVHMFEIKAQGFRGEKLLPIRIIPPKDIEPGRTVKLEGTATWMCCGRDCNPGARTVSIEFPIAREATPADPRWSKRFAESLATVPKSSDEWRADAERRGNEIVLRVKPVSDAAKEHLKRMKDVTFFTEDGVIDPNKPESMSNTGSEIVLTQTVSEYAPKPVPAQLVGILKAPGGWTTNGLPKSIRISVPMRTRVR